MARVVFKSTHQNQTSMFPYDFENFVDKDHPVRIINQIVEKLELSDVFFTYKGGGTSSYHPRMMLKVIIFGYLNNLFSSRKIERALRENIHFMWLSGQSFPDHGTINAFRGKRLKGSIDDIFKQVVLFLQAQGIVTLEEVFTDGTKIESFANRYTFVWKKSIEKQKEKLEAKIQTVLNEINAAIEEDNMDDKKGEGEQKAPIVSAAELNDEIERINQKLKETKAEKTVIKKAENLQKKSLQKLQEYELHLKILGERNSYSKTDHDATFMRMKEDHMKNGQLKPAYNIQLSTENNFITNYTVHQNPGDTTTLQDHLNSFNEKYGTYPKRQVADAGYGGLENYDFMEEKQIENYVKYNYFHKEQTRKFKNDISKPENLYYNEEGDYFICPMGQKMRPVENGKRETSTGYQYDVTIYEAENCSTCPLRGACHKQKGNRRIEINKRLIKHKQIARDNLTSELGIELRRKRNSEVEQTFGQLKSNKGFKRFLLKGIPKISVELGLIALAHNFQKLHKHLIDNEIHEIFEQILNFLRQFIQAFKKIGDILEWLIFEKGKKYQYKTV